MSDEQIIRDAIARSISHSEIVHVEIDGDEGYIHELIVDSLSATMPEHWDCTEWDDGGVTWIDVYSLDESRDEWRINIVLKDD